MDRDMDRYLVIVGRVFLALIFLLSAFGKITNWNGTENMMAAKGIPLTAAALALAILFEVVGGLTVLTGYYARWGALALCLYLIPVTAYFHDFWSYTGPERQNMMIQFLKNLSIFGGLLVTAGYSRPNRVVGRGM
jgi:putative oxidoreductase